MKLRYCQIDGGNFGDDLNTWLWPTLLGDSFLDENDAEWFLGVGSILSHDLPQESRKIVMGSGTGYKRPPVVDESFDVFCVRGPHTAAAMSLPPEKGIADGAYLCLATERFREIAKLQKTHRAAIVPHHQSVETIDWERIADSGDLKFVDPRRHFFDVFEQIARAECVLAESLHGAIIADALRVPWKPFRIGHRFNLFKWNDWFASIEVTDCEILEYPILWNREVSLSTHLKHRLKRACGQAFNKYRWKQRPLRKSTPAEFDQFAQELSDVAKQEQFFLSSDETLHRIEERLLSCLADLSARYGQSLKSAA
ncbi:MAG: hypothetical protein HUJ26_21655 [Planctomycetaceae bacterium]|nr:hypothetical protein [Planctomycetaceae bacterium]